MQRLHAAVHRACTASCRKVQQTTANHDKLQHALARCSRGAVAGRFPDCPRQTYPSCVLINDLGHDGLEGAAGAARGRCRGGGRMTSSDVGVMGVARMCWRGSPGTPAQKSPRAEHIPASAQVQSMHLCTVQGTHRCTAPQSGDRSRGTACAAQSCPCAGRRQDRTRPRWRPPPRRCRRRCRAGCPPLPRGSAGQAGRAWEVGSRVKGGSCCGTARCQPQSMALLHASATGAASPPLATQAALRRRFGSTEHAEFDKAW